MEQKNQNDIERNYTDFKSKLNERRMTNQTKNEEVGSIIQVNAVDEEDSDSQGSDLGGGLPNLIQTNNQLSLRATKDL